MTTQRLSDPPPDSPGVSYRRAVVTFIDILGFRDLVAKKEADEVAGAITRLQETVGPQPATGRRRNAAPIRPSRVHAFSDCVVRIRPFDADNDFGPTLIAELADLAEIQASLGRSGIFVRGGVTVDKVHSTDTLVFGPGLIRAYELENKWAGAPRIIIDPSTIQEFRARSVPKTRMRAQLTQLRRSIGHGEDGLWFVDYLRAASVSIGEAAGSRALLVEHRGALLEAAKRVELKSSVLPKYLWAAKYHNLSCKRILKETTIPGVTISKSELPSFERLRLPKV